MDSLRLKEREGKGSLLGILRNWICISRYALMGGIKAGKIMVFIASGPLYRSQDLSASQRNFYGTYHHGSGTRLNRNPYSVPTS